jgi:hypothetical protein
VTYPSDQAGVSTAERSAGMKEVPVLIAIQIDDGGQDVGGAGVALLFSAEQEVRRPGIGNWVGLLSDQR